ncbi:MAG TPA: PilZ domain-containing protein, partial [Anaerolineales bacterium]|nr:PilZ domain-containing protein [Anaerolineales bacterium]
MSMQLISALNSITLDTEAEVQERRKQPRKDLMSFSQVYELEKGKLIGHLGDITQSGAMVIGDEPFDVNLQMNISILLPNWK